MLHILEPGVISLRKRGILVKESCEFASLEVERTNGADGEVSVQWRTIDGSAQSPEDFQGGEGTLVFKHGEVSTLHLRTGGAFKCNSYR
jgi:solute carrier family 8 (sodium/calcium exchanger)